MTPSILVVDDFFKHPEEIRELALNKEFFDFTGPDGGVYPNTTYVDFPIEEVWTLFKQPIVPVLSVFRLAYESDVPHNPVHSDTGYGEYAGVVYLNSPDQGPSGTAFWTHLDSGADRLPNNCLGLLPTQITNPLGRKLINDWGNMDKWKQTGYVSSKFNRALFYRSSMIHSRFPFRGFGSTPIDGRLILALFFNILYK